jgi:hypothetical protein
MSSQSFPTTPSYATVAQNTSFPKKDQAIVIDALENVQIKEYALALGKIIEPSHIRFLSRISNNRICIYLATKLLADEAIDNKKFITIQGQKLTIRPLINRNKRIILSNVCPIIPHNEIEKKLQEVGIKPMSSISFLRAGLNDTGYSHILSFRRQVYVTPEDFYRLPEKISIEFDETTYWIYLSSDTMTCFLCKKEGHIASKCTEGGIDMTTMSDIEENTPNNAEPLSFKRPHPPTEPSLPEASHEVLEQVTEDNIFSDEDSDTLSQTCIEDTELSNGKKRKKIHRIDTDTTNWIDINEFIKKSSKKYPLTGNQVKEYLESTYGMKNIEEITYGYTENIMELIEMFKDLIPNISCRSVKNRLTRIINKLKLQLKNE